MVEYWQKRFNRFRMGTGFTGLKHRAPATVNVWILIFLIMIIFGPISCIIGR